VPGPDGRPTYAEATAQLRRSRIEAEQYGGTPPKTPFPRWGVAVIIAVALVLCAPASLISKLWGHSTNVKASFTHLNVPAEKAATEGPARTVQAKFGTPLFLGKGGPAIAVSQAGVMITGASATVFIQTAGLYDPKADQYRLCQAAAPAETGRPVPLSWSVVAPPLPQCATWTGPDKTEHLTLVVLTTYGTDTADFTVKDWHWHA
jgi:hypothetical protein